VEQRLRHTGLFGNAGHPKPVGAISDDDATGRLENVLDAVSDSG
jgi:hypothetical protein